VTLSSIYDFSRLTSAMLQIGFFALRDIDVGEELTYDYGWMDFSSISSETRPSESGGVEEVLNQRQQCFCGSGEKCRGWLGGKKKVEEKKVRDKEKLKDGEEKRGKKRKGGKAIGGSEGGSESEVMYSEDEIGPSMIKKSKKSNLPKISLINKVSLPKPRTSRNSSKTSSVSSSPPSLVGSRKESKRHKRGYGETDSELTDLSEDEVDEGEEVVDIEMKKVDQVAQEMGIESKNAGDNVIKELDEGGKKLGEKTEKMKIEESDQ
jgi:hypothetical protein